MPTLSRVQTPYFWVSFSESPLSILAVCLGSRQYHSILLSDRNLKGQISPHPHSHCPSSEVHRYYFFVVCLYFSSSIKKKNYYHFGGIALRRTIFIFVWLSLSIKVPAIIFHLFYFTFSLFNATPGA